MAYADDEHDEALQEDGDLFNAEEWEAYVRQYPVRAVDDPVQLEKGARIFRTARARKRRSDDDPLGRL